jgi:hypothetical protein
MKGFSAGTAIWLALAASAGAQQLPHEPLVRADASGTIGWFNGRTADAEPYDEWYNRSFYGGIEAGWYWTDHLKTEIDFGANTRGQRYAGRPVIVQGISTYEASRIAFSKRKVAISQQYQFVRNAWFHPHVAAGLDFSWERTAEETQAIFVADRITYQPRVLRAPSTTVSTDLVARPFVDVGFKAYMTPRGFFRTDLRIGGRKRVDEALLRFGFGVDF